MRAVQVEDSAGGVRDVNNEEAVQEAIFNEVHRKRYNLAEEAPICQGALRGQFGYTATSPTAQSVLDGTYDFPPEMDAATRELFEEIAHIRGMVPLDSVNGLISRERWQQRWKKVKEETSSSRSGLHFGHYIAGTDCDYISQFHALRVSLALKRGIALERWSKGLSVMLEKMFGVRLVSKLRAILLMEADFNAMNKEVYGVRMMDNARRYKLIPEEIFSEQMRRIEGAIFASGMPVAALMEKAALLTAQQFKKSYSLADFPKIGVIVGPGHNGGDALVIARELHLAGYQVSLFCPIAKLKDLTAQQGRQLKFISLEITEKGLQIQLREDNYLAWLCGEDLDAIAVATTAYQKIPLTRSDK